MTKPRHRGLRYYRCKSNPEEKRFAQAWEKANGGVRYVILEYLLGDGQHAVPVTPREITVAATVVQWLGSPVGQSFLHDLGYSRLDKAEEKRRVKANTAGLAILAYAAAQKLLRKAAAMPPFKEKS